MLACRQYSKPVDVWSVGCIMAELLGRKPFLPGNDYIEQVRFFDFGFNSSICSMLIYFYSAAHLNHKKTGKIARTRARFYNI